MEVTMDQDQKPKKKVSPEHLAKMMAGIQRKKAERAAEKRMVHTRTVEDVKNIPPPREAQRAEVAREDLSRMPEEQLTRRSRDERDVGALDIPRHMRKPGWDYEWKSVRCLGQPTDASDYRLWNDQGWRPVLGRDMPELAGPGGDRGLPIEAQGCHLYTRPMSLTRQAQQEDLAYAQTQMADKYAQSAGGVGDMGIPLARGVKRVPVEVSVEAVGGTGTGRGA